MSNATIKKATAQATTQATTTSTSPYAKLRQVALTAGDIAPVGKRRLDAQVSPYIVVDDNDEASFAAVFAALLNTHGLARGVSFLTAGKGVGEPIAVTAKEVAAGFATQYGKEELSRAALFCAGGLSESFRDVFTSDRDRSFTGVFNDLCRGVDSRKSGKKFGLVATPSSGNADEAFLIPVAIGLCQAEVDALQDSGLLVKGNRAAIAAFIKGNHKEVVAVPTPETK